MNSPSVNTLSHLTISWAATELAAVDESEDFIHFLREYLLWSAFNSRSQTSWFTSSPLLITSQQMLFACSGNVFRHNILLFNNFLPHLKHTGKPALLVVKANKSVHAEWNYSSGTFLLFVHPATEGQNLKISHLQVFWLTEY